MTLSRLLRCAISALAIGSIVSPTRAQDDVVRLVVPFAAGNALDVAARALAESLGRTLNRRVIVDNKSGAGGVLAATEVARARPDGSTLLMGTGALTTGAVLYRKLPYDVLKDFTPITQISSSAGFLLLVRQDSPYRTLAQLLQDARTRPAVISYGSWGTGTSTHLVGELFERAAGVRLLHVPYKGAPLTDFLGGHLDLTWLGNSQAKPLLQEGKVRALAIANGRRVPSLPDVPTLAELGFKDVDLPPWTGLLGPAGMPPELVASLHRAAVAAMKQPAYIAAVAAFESESVGSTPAHFAALIDAEVRSYKRRIGPLNIQLD